MLKNLLSSAWSPLIDESLTIFEFAKDQDLLNALETFNEFGLRPVRADGLPVTSYTVGDTKHPDGTHLLETNELLSFPDRIFKHFYPIDNVEGGGGYEESPAKFLIATSFPDLQEKNLVYPINSSTNMISYSITNIGEEPIAASNGDIILKNTVKNSIEENIIDHIDNANAIYITSSSSFQNNTNLANSIIENSQVNIINQGDIINQSKNITDFQTIFIHDIPNQTNKIVNEDIEDINDNYITKEKINTTNKEYITNEIIDNTVDTLKDTISRERDIRNNYTTKEKINTTNREYITNEIIDSTVDTFKDTISRERDIRNNYTTKEKINTTNREYITNEIIDNTVDTLKDTISRERDIRNNYTTKEKINTTNREYITNEIIDSTVDTFKDTVTDTINTERKTTNNINNSAIMREFTDQYININAESAQSLQDIRMRHSVETKDSSPAVNVVFENLALRHAEQAINKIIQRKFDNSEPRQPVTQAAVVSSLPSMPRDDVQTALIYQARFDELENKFNRQLRLYKKESEESVENKIKETMDKFIRG